MELRWLVLLLIAFCGAACGDTGDAGVAGPEPEGDGSPFEPLSATGALPVFRPSVAPLAPDIPTSPSPPAEFRLTAAAPPAAASVLGDLAPPLVGRNDLVWRNRVTGENLLWLSVDEDRNDVLPLPGMASFWDISAIGAFLGTGDGDDIVWRDGSTGEVRIWSTRRGSVERTVSLGTVSRDWTVVAVGDLDGGGASDDILWRHRATGGVAAWLGRGLSVEVAVPLGSVALEWEVVGIGDFDGHGSPDDLLWRHHSTGDLAVWEMDGILHRRAVPLDRVSPAWRVAGVGAWSASGIVADILWRNGTTGEMALWSRDGAGMPEIRGLGHFDVGWVLADVGDFGLPEDCGPRLVPITGRVRYSSTWLPDVMVGVLDTIADLNRTPPLDSTWTDVDGRFSLCTEPGGRYWLKVYGEDSRQVGDYVGWVARKVTAGDANLLMNLPKNIGALSPPNGAVVEALHPTLVWTRIPEAAWHSIQLNVVEGWELVERPRIGADTVYTVQTELVPGVEYSWHVSAYDAQSVHIGYTMWSYRFTVGDG